jgi:predicted dinucleotide-binding enzyme
MTKALAGKGRGKHDLSFGARDPAKGLAPASEFSGASGTPEAAVAFGEVVVLAVPATTVLRAVAEAGGAPGFAGRIVVDITNPLRFETMTTAMSQDSSGNGSLTEALEAALPGAHLAKAFNMAHTSVWQAPDLRIDGRPYVTLYTAAEKAAEAVGRLIADTGSEPLLPGDNRYAYQLEAAAAMVITFLFSGRPGGPVLNVIQPEKKPVRQAAWRPPPGSAWRRQAMEEGLDPHAVKARAPQPW